MARAAALALAAADLSAVNAEVIQCEYVAADPARQQSTSLLPCHVAESFSTSTMMRATTRCLRSCPTYGHERAFRRGS